MAMEAGVPGRAGRVAQRRRSSCGATRRSPDRAPSTWWCIPRSDVTQWTLDELDKRVAEVRDLYVHTLEDWPGSAGPVKEVTGVAGTTGPRPPPWGAPTDMSDWEGVSGGPRPTPYPLDRRPVEILDWAIPGPGTGWWPLTSGVTRAIPRLRDRVVEPILPLVPPAFSPTSTSTSATICNGSASGRRPASARCSTRRVPAGPPVPAGATALGGRAPRRPRGRARRATC